ncbi:hypothetical protein JB92DRAFT_2928235 [Gautieria morchelliformis]|nr:hypothetical protein JB92DRAFT_2928235 [Gautieria morchelliformis]
MTRTIARHSLRQDRSQRCLVRSRRSHHYHGTDQIQTTRYVTASQCAAPPTAIHHWHHTRTTSMSGTVARCSLRRDRSQPCPGHSRRCHRPGTNLIQTTRCVTASQRAAPPTAGCPRGREGRACSLARPNYTCYAGYLTAPGARLRDVSDPSMDSLHHSATPRWSPTTNADAAVRAGRRPELVRDSTCL